MRRKICGFWAISLVLANQVAGVAQEFYPAEMGASPVTQGYNHGYQRGCSLKQIWKWLTYRPLPMGKYCKCRPCNPVCIPPLYTFLLGEYGPRSPLLGYAGPYHNSLQVPQEPNIPVNDASAAVPDQIPPSAVPVHDVPATSPDSDVPSADPEGPVFPKN